MCYESSNLWKKVVLITKLRPELSGNPFFGFGNAAAKKD
jgi:hypothetical protein